MAQTTSLPDGRQGVHEFFRAKCNEVINVHKFREGSRQILVRIGEFSEDVVSTILCLIENKMEEWGERKGVIKRVFSIIVEQLQNIRINGSRDETGQQIGFIIVSKAGNEFHISTLNLADTNNINAIRNKIGKISHLRPDELKQLYMDTLSEGKISHKGGAGLGFITIAMKSNNQADYGFEKIDGSLTLFSVHVKVVCE
ncbi:MAG: hypothetical protein HYY40_10355 [Bacteroidetes bacterium]|nr:hypothetical protein [Bacteroidota bacterium]